jgi:hypothetical protein
MPTEFFGFGNHETFHFFIWICESDASLPDRLIADAFQKAEEKLGDEEYEGDDTCCIVRDCLLEKLRDGILYGEIAPNLEPSARHLKIGSVTPSPDSLLQPIFARALARIDCFAVAKALLIRAGKWNPDPDFRDY